MKKEIRIQFGMRKKEVICTLNHAVVESLGGALQKFSHFVLVLYENGSFKIFTYDDSKNYRNDFVNLTVLSEEEFFRKVLSGIYQEHQLNTSVLHRQK